MLLSHLQIPSVVRKVNNFLSSSLDDATEAFFKLRNCLVFVLVVPILKRSSEKIDEVTFR